MTHYTPVVRAKTNDISALNLLSASARMGVRPLVEPAMSLTGNELTTDVADAASKLIGKLNNFVYYFDPLGFESFDRHMQTFRTLFAAGENFIPTIGFGRGKLNFHALARFLDESQLPLAIRLEKFDLEDASEDTWEKLIQLTHALGIGASRLTLILDFGDLSAAHSIQLIESGIDFLSLQPKNFIGLGIVILGGSALKSVAPTIPTDGHAGIERKELHVWASLQFELDGVHDLEFGDYGVMAPSFVFPTNGSANANAKIRYTRGAQINYFRGHALYQPNRFDQYHELAQRVMNSGIYLGPHFSYGDQAIQDCALRESGPGNLGTWVKTDTNHHIEYTARQIQKIASSISLASDEKEISELLTNADIS